MAATTLRSPPPPRPDRRHAIVQVAYRLIAERGLEGLRFGDVARQAGINNGTLLYYFASKEALIQGVVAYLLEQFSDGGVPPPPRPAPSDALAELRWEFEDAAGRLHQPQGVVYVELLARAQRDPTVAAALRGMDDAWRAWLVSIFERGRAQGLFRADLDAPLMATTMMAGIRGLGLGLQAVTTDDTRSVERAVSALASLIVAAVVAPSPASAPRSASE